MGQVWEHFLQYVEDIGELRKERSRKPPVKAALQGFADEEVFAEIQSRRRRYEQIDNPFVAAGAPRVAFDREKD